MPVHLETLAEEMRRATQHKGILLSDHRCDEVLALCDTVYFPHNGRVLQLGPDPADELRAYGYLPE